MSSVDRDFTELKRWFGLPTAFGPHDQTSIDVGQVSSVNANADNAGYQPAIASCETARAVSA